jgi:hypothetical protein
VDEETRAVKLLQGYLWHPRDQAIDLADYLPRTLEPDIHLLWDAMPAAPFAFFDDGTLSATQQLYQFTALKLLEGDDEAARYVPALAERLGELLEATPAGVGWQLFEDLRDV